MSLSSDVNVGRTVRAPVKLNDGREVLIEGYLPSEPGEKDAEVFACYTLNENREPQERILRSFKVATAKLTFL